MRVTTKKGYRMASKRKTNGCASVRRVMEAINKVGYEVHDFFSRAEHFVDTPPGFNATKEAIRFNLFRSDGVAEHPDYEIPVCILEFAETVLSADCPRKLLADLQSRLSVAARQTAKQLVADYPQKTQPHTMTRPAPSYT